MLAISASSPRNRLLAPLSAADFGLLQPHPIDDVYFMDAGTASVVSVQAKESGSRNAGSFPRGFHV